MHQHAYLSGGACRRESVPLTPPARARAHTHTHTHLRPRILARRLLCKWSAQRGVAAVSTRAEDVAGLWDFMLAMPDKAAIDKLAKA